MRRMALAPTFSGAYLGSISRVASVRLPTGSSSFLTTLPTLTPATRTSAWSASWVASWKDTWAR